MTDELRSEAKKLLHHGSLLQEERKQAELLFMLAQLIQCGNKQA